MGCHRPRGPHTDAAEHEELAQGVDEERDTQVNWSEIASSLKDELPGDRVPRRSPFARLMYGETPPPTRRSLQFLFNERGLMPQVLLAQAAVASEGLNLHEACRKVVLFHLDWNPARIEQQIGRVDRENSCWMGEFDEWLKKPEPRGEAPRIEVHTVSLAGTYDDRRQKIVHDRLRVLKAQIFGELVDPAVLSELPTPLQENLARLAPDFTPPDI